MITCVFRSVCFSFLTPVCYLFLLSSGLLYMCGKWKCPPVGVIVEPWVYFWCIIDFSVSGFSSDHDTGWSRWELFNEANFLSFRRSLMMPMLPWIPMNTKLRFPSCSTEINKALVPCCWVQLSIIPNPCLNFHVNHCCLHWNSIKNATTNDTTPYISHEILTDFWSHSYFQTILLGSLKFLSFILSHGLSGKHPGSFNSAAYHCFFRLSFFFLICATVF